MKKQLNVRVSDESRQQLKELATLYGSEGKVVEAALGALWLDEFSTAKKQKRAEVLEFINRPKD